MSTLQNWNRLTLPKLVLIPASGIILFNTQIAAPADYQDFASANGAYIIGAGGSYSSGANADPTSSTISLASNGGHNTPSDKWWNFSSGAGSGKITNEPGLGIYGAHSHTTTVKVNPNASNVKLIQATTETGIPSGGILLADAEIENLTLETSLNGNGGLLRADPTKTFGIEVRSHTQACTSSSMDHAHRQNSQNNKTGTTRWTGVPATAFAHDHAISLSGSTKRLILAAYIALQAEKGAKGAPIILYPTGAIPSKWALCNGSNGTPDARNNFLEINSGNIGATTGDNAYSSNGTDSKPHNHGNPTDRQYRTGLAPHYTDVLHAHAVAWAQTLLPKYYALQFIKYTG